MFQSHDALRTYGAFKREISSERDIEIQLFSSITSRLKKMQEGQSYITGDHAQALTDNVKLWTLLMLDLLSPSNPYPVDLKSSLISLAEFTRSHTQKIYQKEGDVDVLVDINTAILNGLIQARDLGGKNKDANMEEVA